MFDLVIIGHGAAGFSAAIRASELGAKAAMVGGNATPRMGIGGTCINVGCVPSKRLIHLSKEFRKARQGYGGLEFHPELDYRRIVEDKDRLVRRLRKEKYEDVLEGLEVEYFEGLGQFVSKSRVKVGSTVLEGKKFLICTGARTRVPDIPGLRETGFLTNEDALAMKELPESLCVLGAGAVGIEFAQMFANFGVKVSVVQRSDRILSREEPEISKMLESYMKQAGIEIYTGATVKSVSEQGVETTRGLIECEGVLLAMGRTPNTDRLGLENTQVEVDARGFVKADRHLRTSQENVWAAGDVTGPPMLETVAAREGYMAVENALNNGRMMLNPKEVPHVVFSDPEVASVGLTDEEARKSHECRCLTVFMNAVPKAHIIGDTRGLVKIVADNKTRRILGVHVLAPQAAEMIHEATMIVKNRMKLEDVLNTLHVFPTLSEAIKLAAQSHFRDISRLSCCTI